MDYFDNTRKNWIITFLVFLNITFLASLWFSSHRRPPHPHEQRDHINRQFQRELELGDAQYEEVKLLRQEHFEQTHHVLDQIHEKKKEMFNALKGEIPDTSQANNFAEEIGTLEWQIESLMIKHYLELKDVCNKEQKLKLENVFHRAMRKHERKPPRDR